MVFTFNGYEIVSVANVTEKDLFEHSKMHLWVKVAFYINGLNDVNMCSVRIKDYFFKSAPPKVYADKHLDRD